MEALIDRMITAPAGQFCQMTVIGRTRLYELLNDGPLASITTGKGRPSLATLARWSERWPGCNVGIVTGHRVTVIDIDDAGLIDEMIRRFGATPLQVGTPSGGLHLYYASSGERCGTLRPSLPVD